MRRNPFQRSTVAQGTISDGIRLTFQSDRYRLVIQGVEIPFGYRPPEIRMDNRGDRLLVSAQLQIGSGVPILSEGASSGRLVHLSLNPDGWDQEGIPHELAPGIFSLKGCHLGEIMLTAPLGSGFDSECLLYLLEGDVVVAPIGENRLVRLSVNPRGGGLIAQSGFGQPEYERRFAKRVGGVHKARIALAD